MEENITKDRKNNPIENNLGFIFWKLESIEKFLPCYNILIK